MTIPGSAEQQIEERIDRMISDLDELCGMARNAETVDLVEGQAIGIGQVQFRAALILDFLTARKIPTLRMIKNG